VPLLRDLSFRYKIPLRGAVLVLATATLLTASLLYQEYLETKNDVVVTSTGISRMMANALVAPLIHDDVWQAYEVINSPFAAAAEGRPDIADFVVVLDRRNRTFISRQPADYPVLGDPGRVNADFYRLPDFLLGIKEFETRAVDLGDVKMIYLLTPIMSDGVPLGTLVMGYSKTAFLPEFLEILRNAALTMLLVIAVVIPASWVYAQRFAKPLVDLANVMGKVGARIPDEAEIRIEESKDEIGQVVTAFKGMLCELRDKQALEDQMILSERLAAVGRLSAAIAHEINNPLGGMLNAISTFNRHGNDGSLTVETLALIEGGLQQISETVSALLVEATHPSHPLNRQDIEDIRTLVLPGVHDKKVQFTWDNRVDEVAILPATPVRQILLNLLLNALQAVFEEGKVSCRIGRENGVLKIVVSNDGQFIALEAMEALFEPLPSTREGSHGLGLWVTYQVVKQLGGEITAASEPGETRFTVTLPMNRNE
jgi:signal transduction histidine kinase